MIGSIEQPHLCTFPAFSHAPPSHGFSSRCILGSHESCLAHRRNANGKQSSRLSDRMRRCCGTLHILSRRLYYAERLRSWLKGVIGGLVHTPKPLGCIRTIMCEYECCCLHMVGGFPAAGSELRWGGDYVGCLCADRWEHWRLWFCIND